MRLHLSHDFDSIVHAPPTQLREGKYYFGLSKLLIWLVDSSVCKRTCLRVYFKLSLMRIVEWYSALRNTIPRYASATI